ncbi:unnamed protein product, partial [Iphiclides podalirius]
MAASCQSDDHPPPGVVELREDVPLKSSGSDPRRCAGPRLISTAFAALSAAITLALLTQIYYGDYEVVPHGSVATSEARCSRGGLALLREGGGAMDAAAAAALCLAAASPAATALDASGSLLYWEYRLRHEEPPVLAEWGAAGEGGAAAGAGAGAGGGWPRLPCALAQLHARRGRLPWARLLTPALRLASGMEDGVEDGASTGARTPTPNVALAELLRHLQRNTSAEVWSACGWPGLVREAPARPVAAAGWRGFAGGARPVGDALALALAGDADGALASLERAHSRGAWNASGTNSGLAVADPFGAYAVLVTLLLGLPTPNFPSMKREFLRLRRAQPRCSAHKYLYQATAFLYRQRGARARA